MLDPGRHAGGAESGGQDSDPDEVAWNTAVEAAPWLVGTSEPEQAIDPDELYDKLAPFKQRVADDIRGDDDQWESALPSGGVPPRGEAGMRYGVPSSSHGTLTYPDRNGRASPDSAS